MVGLSYIPAPLAVIRMAIRGIEPLLSKVAFSKRLFEKTVHASVPKAGTSNILVQHTRRKKYANLGRWASLRARRMSSLQDGKYA